MSNYKWTIVALECIPDLEGIKDYVVTCHWRYGISNGDDPTAEGYIYTDIFGAQSFPQDTTQSNFIPYADLTEAQVIEWLVGSMDVSEMQIQLDKRLNDIVNPPIVQNPLPWNN